MDDKILNTLWAKSKPWHPLWCHLLDAAAVSQALLPHFGNVEPLPSEWTCLIVGSHDIGKADDWFQNKDDGLAAELNALQLDLPSRSPMAADLHRYFRHEARSAKWMRCYLAERGWNKHGAVQVVAGAITGHHGDFAAPVYAEENNGRKKMWDELRAALFARLWQALEPPEFALADFPHNSVAGLKLSGLIVVSDWLASNDNLYHYQDLPRDADTLTYWQATAQRAREVVAELHFEPSSADWAAMPSSFGEVWPQLKGSLRPSQTALEREVLSGLSSGLCLIEAPMGEGKTEGALYLATEWNRQRRQSGAYLALPTQATSNQMHSRYRAFLKDRGQRAPRLVHGMAWLVDEATIETAPQTFGAPSDEEIARQWFRPLRRALLESDGVGTVDQALLAALHVKFGFLRLLGLGQKVLIVDEVHAYDDFMSTILERLLEWCGAANIGVILLSATLSHEQKKRLVGAYSGRTVADEEFPLSREKYPLLTFAERAGVPREVEVRRDEKLNRTLTIERHEGLLDSSTKTAALAQLLTANGGNACVLCNTVKSAQEVFAELRKIPNDTEIFLFHARFRAAVRSRIETQIIERFGKEADAKRPKKSIVVATQVVEQSLDVDFDYMISEVAPVDLLLQRSGRLHRHPAKTRPADLSPTLHLLLPPVGELKFGASERVYQREILLRTLSWLHQKTAWNLPADFRQLIEGVYGNEALPNDLIPCHELQEALKKRDKKRREDEQKARYHLLPQPNPRSFELARRSAAESENDSEAGNYFRAATRLGDDSRPTLVLHDAKLIALAASSLDESAKPPSRKRLRALFENKVNLPGWWFKGATPATGYEAPQEGGQWLRGHLILPLINREWHGTNDKGQAFVIRDDELLGLCRVVSEIMDSNGADEEADAGLTN